MWPWMLLLTASFARPLTGTEIQYDPATFADCHRPVATAIAPGPKVGGTCFAFVNGADAPRAWLWTDTGGFVILQVDPTDTAEKTSIRDIDENGLALGAHEYFTPESLSSVQNQTFTWDGGTFTPQLRSPDYDWQSATVFVHPMFIHAGRIVSRDVGGVVEHAPGGTPTPLGTWEPSLFYDPIGILGDGSIVGDGAPDFVTARTGYVYGTTPVAIPVFPGSGHVVSQVLAAGPGTELFGMSWLQPGAPTYFRYEDGVHTEVPYHPSAAVSLLPDGGLLYADGAIHTVAGGLEPAEIVGSIPWRAPVDVGPGGLILRSGETTSDPGFVYFSQDEPDEPVDVSVWLVHDTEWPIPSELALQVTLVNEGPGDAHDLTYRFDHPLTGGTTPEVVYGDTFDVPAACTSDTRGFDCTISTLWGSGDPLSTTFVFRPLTEGPHTFAVEVTPSEPGSDPDLLDDALDLGPFDIADLAFAGSDQVFVNSVLIFVDNLGPSADTFTVEHQWNPTNDPSGESQPVAWECDPCSYSADPLGESVQVSLRMKPGAPGPTEAGELRIEVHSDRGTIDPRPENNMGVIPVAATAGPVVVDTTERRCAAAGAGHSLATSLFGLLVVTLRRRGRGLHRPPTA